MQGRTVAKEELLYLLQGLLERANKILHKGHLVTGSLKPSRSSVRDNANDNSTLQLRRRSGPGLTYQHHEQNKLSHQPLPPPPWLPTLMST